MTSAGEAREKAVLVNRNWFSHSGKWCENSSRNKKKKKKIELPYDPVIPLLRI